MKKLVLAKETVRSLETLPLRDVVGGSASCAVTDCNYDPGYITYGC
jgi:hypothetical protein